MDSDRFKKIEEIFHEALELSAENRRSFLEKRCNGDAELKSEVESLLAIEDNPASFIEKSPEGLAAEMLSEPAKPTKTIQKKIGRYQVESILGVGGMGTVYLASDTRLARRVALKVLPAEIVKDNDRVQRFMHEARAASALNHPHILTVYELDEAVDEDGETVHFISMEFVEGKTFDRLIYSNKTSTSDLLGYLVQVAKGLAKAHSAGIVHRDLKPENIMISADGYAKILDFGLAKLTDAEHELHELQQHKSRSGVILGTLGYMSPEQAQGSPDIDARSDIFAFGCILYEAMAKRKAFEADIAIDSLHKIIHAEPVPLKNIDPNVADELVGLIEKCLRKIPEERFQHTTQIAIQLEAIASRKTAENFPAVSREDVKTIIRNKNSTQASASLSFSGQRRQVTAMFVDASAISDMLEEFDPEKSLQMMNDFWSSQLDLISGGGGKISERLAGTNLAVWGTEQTSESDPEKAVRTALELQSNTRDYFKKNLSAEFKLTGDEKEELAQTDFLKIAISTGTVLIGSSTDTGEFLTSGSAVSAAKRALSKASIGDVLITHDTYRHVRGIFEVNEAKLKSDLSFKRKKQQAKIYSIHGVKPKAFRMETRGVEGIETSLVGREAEMIKLRGTLEAVREDKELQVLTVVGEAGLGKSRLLFEFHDQIELSHGRFYVFKARALESMRGMPFSFVRDLFSYRFEISETDSESEAREKFVDGILKMIPQSNDKFGHIGRGKMKAEFIGHLIGFDFSESLNLKDITDDEKQIQDRALHYSVQFFQSISSEFPAVFYLDDIHWADDESLDFFEYLVEECANSPILMIELTRPILFERRPHRGEGKENIQRLNLKPLTKRESGKLVNDILQRAEDVPKDLSELLVSNSEGNPFYVEELIKMLIEHSVVRTSGEHWTVDVERLGEIAVPPTLTGVLQSRLDKLSLWEKRILQKASVIGREFWDTAFKNFEAEINVPTILESLRLKELLFRKESSSVKDANEYIFKHALLRDVVYETVLLDVRKQWHLETAEWLIESKGERRNEYLALIAEHFEKGGEAEKSAFWYGKAAGHARRSYALETAEAYYRRVLRMWDEIEVPENNSPLTNRQIMKWKHGLGRVYFAQAKYRDSIQVFADLLDMAKSLDDKLWQAYANWGLSYSEFESGETRKALENAVELVRLARDPDVADSSKGDYLLRMGFNRQSRALISLGEFENAIKLTERNLKSLSLSDSTGLEVKANCLHLLAAANLFLGRIREARKYELQEVEISRKIGDLRTVGNGLNSLGFQCYLEGDSKEALRYYEESLEIAGEIGNKSGAIMVRSNICGAKVLIGDFEEAEHELRSLISKVGNKGHFLVPEMYRFLAESLIGQGKYEEALEAADQSLTLSEKNENQETIGEAWRVLGIVSSCIQKPVLVDGESRSAVDCFKRGLAIFEKIKMEANHAQILHNFGMHCLAIGEQAKADELFGKEKEISDRLDLNTPAKSPYFVP